jgi:hypothetical protein
VESRCGQRPAAAGDPHRRARLAGRTVGEIADGPNIHRKTVSRLKGDQRFAKLVRALQAAAVERSVSILVHARVRAANTLVDLPDHPNPAIALRAATMILERVQSWRILLRSG